jgi:hypothetical protein
VQNTNIQKVRLGFKYIQTLGDVQYKLHKITEILKMMMTITVTQLRVKMAPNLNFFRSTELLQRAKLI